ncbi:MAG: hypothetical protein K2Q24_14385 [Chitinophagaceae bacterium]|nr:hypothetical protein [Chitinophagaceae bacterium]
MNKKLENFIAFIRSSDKEMCDLEYLASPVEWIKPLLGGKAIEYFNVYFRNKAGDLVAEWDEKGIFDSAESYPIVWLSSEGSPHTVIAKDTDEFLSILPYGGEILLGVPVLIKKYKIKPKIVVDPEKKFSNENIRKAFDYQASFFIGHKELVKFILEDIGIKLNDSPVKTIKETLELFPDLDNWIEENL